jgi:dihydropteroate synthase
VGADDEAAKLVPALIALAERTSVPLSADTFSPAVATRAVAAGAAVVNDIGGGADEMLEAVAAAGCGYVLMHIEGPPRRDREPRSFADPVDHLRAWFEERVRAAVAAGVAEERIAIDPGLDFDLTVADDLTILRRLAELHSLGRPLYVSLSRKDFLGAVIAGSWSGRAPAGEREAATCAAAALAVAAGAQVLRLHDASALDAVRVADRIANG